MIVVLPGVKPILQLAPIFSVLELVSCNLDPYQLGSPDRIGLLIPHLFHLKIVFKPDLTGD